MWSNIIHPSLHAQFCIEIQLERVEARSNGLFRWRGERMDEDSGVSETRYFSNPTRNERSECRVGWRRRCQCQRVGATPLSSRTFLLDGQWRVSDTQPAHPHPPYPTLRPIGLSVGLLRCRASGTWRGCSALARRGFRSLTAFAAEWCAPPTERRGKRRAAEEKVP